jgi:hypothetical protein
LIRLRALKFHPEAMPGVEHAVKNSRGRIVPAMEEALEKYPTSPAGDRHAARLTELGRLVKPLLERIDETGEPMTDEVIAAAGMLNQLWDETISELPKLVYLERPTYSYDSMMFEKAGTNGISSGCQLGRWSKSFGLGSDGSPGRLDVLPKRRGMGATGAVDREHRHGSREWDPPATIHGS